MSKRRSTVGAGYSRPLSAPADTRPSAAHGTDVLGVVLVLVSAVGFGLMAVFAKEAYAEGSNVVSLLAGRFTLAALVLWAIVLVRARVTRTAVAVGRATLRAGILLGLVGYAAQAGLYFGALTRIDASLVALLLYLYPAVVVVGAILTGRETPSPRTWSALGLATGGGALVLLGGGVSGLDGLGVAMAIGAGVVYGVYILVTDRATTGGDPLVLCALIATGGAISFVAAGLGSGTLEAGMLSDAAGWIVAIALFSTVLPVTFFVLGMARVGPSTAAIVSTVEPVVTVVLAMAIYDERLGPVQVVGGALVLAAVIVLSARRRTPTAVPAP